MEVAVMHLPKFNRVTSLINFQACSTPELRPGSINRAPWYLSMFRISVFGILCKSTYEGVCASAKTANKAIVRVEAVCNERITREF